MEINNTTNDGMNERIGSIKNSPLYNEEEAKKFNESTREAEDMTWEELKAQADGLTS